MGKTLNLNTINTDKKNMSFNDILSNDEREKIKAIMQRNDNELNILDYKIKELKHNKEPKERKIILKIISIIIFKSIFIIKDI